jgi:hypothetical protein
MITWVVNIITLYIDIYIDVQKKLRTEGVTIAEELVN